MLRSLICAVALLPFLAAACHASDIDLGYREYQKVKANKHKAFAYSPLGDYSWVADAPDAARAAERALRNCNSARRKDRQPCALGDVDGRKTGGRFQEVLVGRMTLPIIVVEQRKGEKRTYSGTMTVTRHWSPNRRISLSYANGTRKCTNGRAFLGGFGIRFTIQCDGQQFSGRARKAGKTQSGFYKGSQLFEAEISSGDTTLTFKSG